MIHAVSIQNFKCFKSFKIDDCSRVNVVVGDNGSGKTALLEAIFLALAGNPVMPMRYKQQRGQEGTFTGAPRQIEEAIWGEIFNNFDTRKTITIDISGDGTEARSLIVSRGQRGLFHPINVAGATVLSPSASGAALGTPVTFQWRDHEGGQHVYAPTFNNNGIQGLEQDEDLPDFFYFASQVYGSAIENAQRFSDLSRAKNQAKFIELFTREYNWIEDLSIEVIGGTPSIYATVRGMTQKVPVNLISGAISRFMGILLSIASRPHSVVLVDEVENGIFYTHYVSYWRALLSFAREFDSQLIVTTHSNEWIKALVSAAGDKIDDVSLWQIERHEDGPKMFKSDGNKLRDAAEYGADLRGSASAE